MAFIPYEVIKPPSPEVGVDPLPFDEACKQAAEAAQKASVNTRRNNQE